MPIPTQSKVIIIPDLVNLDKRREERDDNWKLNDLPGSVLKTTTDTDH
jgi:hypothetical protein